MLTEEKRFYDFVLAQTPDKKFAFTSLRPDSDGVLKKYLKAELTDRAASSAFGVQTTRIVKCFFDGTKVFDDMRKAIESNIIDKETGISSKPISANFYKDYPCGFPYTATMANGTVITNRFVSFLVLAGDSFDKERDRAIRSAAKTRVAEPTDVEADIQHDATVGATITGSTEASF